MFSKNAMRIAFPACMLLFAFCAAIIFAQLDAQEKNEPTKRVYGPRGIMDTSPVIEAPVEEEEPVDLAAIAAIPFEQRLAKFDTLIGDFNRKGILTPYHMGQLVGNLDSHSAADPDSIPYIWIKPGDAGKRVDFKDKRSSDRPYFELELNGDGRSAWKSRAVPVAPGTLYRLSAFASSSKSQSDLTVGIEYAKRTWNDIVPLPEKGERDWRKPRAKRSSFIFLSSQDSDNVHVQLGPGKTGNTYHFSQVHLEPVLPIYRGVQSDKPLNVKVLGGTSSFVGIPGKEPKNMDKRGGDFLRLGDGEKIEKNRYEFSGTFEGNNGMFHRPLVSSTAKFDTDCFVFSENSELIYKFSLQPIRADEKPGQFTPPPLVFSQFEVSARYRDAQKNVASIQWSPDGKNWTEISAAKTEVKNLESIFVRFRNPHKEKFSIDSVSFHGTVNNDEYSGEGKTVFAILQSSDRHGRGTPAEHCMVVPLMFSRDNALYKLFVNESDQDQSFSGGYMDYFGSEDSPGGHGDGPGKWTIMTLGNKWGPVRQYDARINIWAYNWFSGANLFSFSYPGISFRYEIITPHTNQQRNEE